MKKSNFDRLMERYVTGRTSNHETRKIEAFLKAVGKRKIHWIADETEELFCRNIRDKKILPNNIAHQVKGLVKLHVRKAEWMKFTGMDVYFDKSCY